MDQQQYTRLVRRLEVDSTINPAGFRAKVLLIGASAYLALACAVIGLGALLWLACNDVGEHHGALATVRLALCALFLLPLLAILLSMFFMRLSPPEGRRLTRHESPKLFRTLDRLRTKLGGPAIDVVLLDDDFNASICQLPRFGLFGRHINYLVLGLPYMLGVPPREMLATVAHEYGHLCGGHGKFGTWVYRQRRTFGALHAQVSDSRGNLLHRALAGALDRFMPYYNAYTFVLSRQNEFEADRVATTVLGAPVNASGLVRDALLGRWVHDVFWPRLYRQADRAPAPSFMPFKSMRTAFIAAYDEWAAPDRLTAAWRRKSGLDDTHPALRERVEATGQTPRLPERGTLMAAQALLGNTTTRLLIDEFDQQWWQRERKPWEARCRYATRSRARLAELAAVGMEHTRLAELQELALLTAEFDSPQAAKPVLKHLLKQPGGPFPKAALVLGRILLDENNLRGLDYLASAAMGDRRLLDQVVRLGCAYLLERQNAEAARQWREKFLSAIEED